eukprot:jgi/Bigna1/78852/fgenesh1_pg.57_\
MPAPYCAASGFADTVPIETGLAKAGCAGLCFALPYFFLERKVRHELDMNGESKSDEDERVGKVFGSTRFVSPAHVDRKILHRQGRRDKLDNGIPSMKFYHRGCQCVDLTDGCVCSCAPRILTFQRIIKRVEEISGIWVHCRILPCPACGCLRIAGRSANQGLLYTKRCFLPFCVPCCGQWDTNWKTSRRLDNSNLFQSEELNEYPCCQLSNGDDCLLSSEDAICGDVFNCGNDTCIVARGICEGKKVAFKYLDYFKTSWIGLQNSGSCSCKLCPSSNCCWDDDLPDDGAAPSNIQNTSKAFTMENTVGAGSDVHNPHPSAPSFPEANRLSVSDYIAETAEIMM